MVWTAAWQMGAEGRAVRVATREEAEALANQWLVTLGEAPRRCHVRVIEGVPTPWGTSRTLSHYTRERGTAWRLVAGSPLPEPVAAAAE